MLGVDGRVNTSLSDATRVSVAKMFGPTPSSKGGEGGEGSAAKSLLGSVHQDMLPELMRLRNYVER